MRLIGPYPRLERFNRVSVRESTVILQEETMSSLLLRSSADGLGRQFRSNSSVQAIDLEPHQARDSTFTVPAPRVDQEVLTPGNYYLCLEYDFFQEPVLSLTTTGRLVSNEVRLSFQDTPEYQRIVSESQRARLGQVTSRIAQFTAPVGFQLASIEPDLDRVARSSLLGPVHLRLLQTRGHFKTTRRVRIAHAR